MTSMCRCTATAPPVSQSALCTRSTSSRGAPPERGTRASSAGAARRFQAVAPHENEQLAGARHGEQIRLLETERPGLRAVDPRRVDLRRAALPGGAVENRLPVGREAAVENVATLERHALEAGGRGRVRGAPGREPRPGGRENAGCQSDSDQPQRPSPRRRDGRRPPARDARELREMRLRGPQVARQVFGRRVTLGRALGETSLDDPANRRRDLRGNGRDGFRFLANDRREHLGPRLARERAAARGHLVEHRAQRELVGTEIEGAAARLLGRHVGDGSHHDARFGGRAHGRRGRLLARLGLRGGHLRQPEVEDLHEAVLRDHHVFGLQIPVHDPRPVRLGQPLGHLGGERDQPLHGERPVGEQLSKRRSVDELHREIGDGVRLPDLVDRDDRRVVQRGSGARLPLEAAQPVRVGREGRGQDLDRHVAAEARVMRPVHLAHAARPERGHELIGTEPGFGREGQLRRF